jgi:hypothetical protein
MSMTSHNNKYIKIIGVLKKSKPELLFPEHVEDKIINRITGVNQEEGRLPGILEGLFGWIYIGWIRRALTTIAIMLVGLFVYQQAFIMRQVRQISEKVINISNGSNSVTSQGMMKMMTFYKISNSLSSGETTLISERELEELINSYQDIIDRYRDLMEIIKTDTVLKELIEKRLEEKMKYKPDI